MIPRRSASRRPALRTGTVVFALALAAIPLPARAQASLQSLLPAIKERAAEHHGNVFVSVLDPNTGEQVSLRGDEPVPSASVIKVGVLVELFQQVDSTRLRLEDPVMLIDADKRPGSGLLTYLDAPLKLTLRDAAFLMITMSDNTATNLVVDKLGIWNIDHRMEVLGLHHTKLHSKVFWRHTSIYPDSSAKYGLGVITANEMTKLLGMIYRGETVSKEASEQMVDMLKHNYAGSGIPRDLPPEASVAHKTGALNAVRHDCGIVFNPKRDFVLCVLTTDNEDKRWNMDAEPYVTIGDIAKIVYDGLVGTGQ